jgi:hypothetical protein
VSAAYFGGGILLDFGGKRPVAVGLRKIVIRSTPIS